MKKSTFFTLVIATFFSGCGGGGSTTTKTTPSTSLQTTTYSTTSGYSIDLPLSYTPDDGRLLASNCFNCHGTNGVSTTSWDSIAGEDDLHDEIFDDEPIMNAQAKGFSYDEITLMQNYLSKIASNKSEDNESSSDENEEDDD